MSELGEQDHEGLMDSAVSDQINRLLMYSERSNGDLAKGMTFIRRPAPLAEWRTALTLLEREVEELSKRMPALDGSNVQTLLRERHRRLADIVDTAATKVKLLSTSQIDGVGLALQDALRVSIDVRDRLLQGIQEGEVSEEQLKNRAHTFDKVLLDDLERLQRSLDSQGLPRDSESIAPRERTRRLERSQRGMVARLELLEDRVDAVPEQLSSALAERLQSLDLLKAEIEAAIAIHSGREPVLLELLDQFQSNKARAAFEERSKEHSKQEKRNEQLFYGALGLLGAAVLWTFLTEVNDFGAPALIALGARRLLAVLLTGLAARIALRRWNVERHLRILYDHRVAAIEQLERILASETDANERSRLRREASLMFLKDPSTGYLDHESSDISITPLVAAADKLSGRAT